MINELVEQLRDAIPLKGHKFIYLMHDGRIGKKYSGLCEEQAKNVYELGKFVHNNGVNVPEMHELVELDSFLLSELIHMEINLDKNNWLLLMQKINGTYIRNLKGNEFEKSMELYKRELEKVLELKICPTDSTTVTNSLYTAEEEQVYLIDLDLWHKGTTEQLNECYRVLKDAKPNIERPNVFYFEQMFP